MIYQKLNKTKILTFGLIASISTFPSNAIAELEGRQYKLFKDQSYCMELAQGKIVNGRAIVLAKCKQKGHPAQTWIGGDKLDIPCAVAEGGCAYQIKLAANPKYCLDYTYSTKPPKKDGSTLVQLWQCKDAQNGNAAYWGSVYTAQSQANIFYPQIPNQRAFNFRIGVPEDSLKQGTKLRLFEDDNNWHLWTI